MKTIPSLPRLVLFGSIIFFSFSIPTFSQTTDQEIQRKIADLEQQRIALEKRSLELQRKELELEKARQALREKESAQSLNINLSGDVLFDYDKATLKPAAEEALKKVAVVLSLFPESQVTVEGHSDAKGGKAVNLQLSKERAGTVRDWLVKNGGISSASIIGTGFGEEIPVASNTNADGSDNPIGRALNRRVSIIVSKPGATPPPAP